MKKLLFVLTILCLFPMTVNAARLVSDNATESPQTCEFN